MTQKEKILDHIQKFGSITAYTAIYEYGITQIAARICELKREGYKITTERHKGINRYQEPFYYVSYMIENKQGGINNG